MQEPESHFVPHYFDLLKRLVDINTGTGNRPGAQKVRDILVREFEALGFECTHHEVGEGHRVLECVFRDANPDLLLSGHLDTVFPESSEFQALTEKDGKLQGPGIIDMKGGVVLLLQALAELQDASLLRRVKVLLNDDEEIGSVHSQKLLQKRSEGIPYGLVFEPGFPDSAVMTSQSGVYVSCVTQYGKAAHAGLEPHLGLNACVEMAHTILRIYELNDPERGLTVNSNVIQGGSAHNVICEKAKLEVDIRYIDPKDLEQTLETIESIVATPRIFNESIGLSCRGKVEEQGHLPSLPPEPMKKLFAMAQDCAERLGESLEGRHVGYGSDANHLAQTGMQVLVGLGPWGGSIHSHHEFMEPSSYPRRLALTKALIAEILK